MTESRDTDERTKLKHPYGEMWASFAPTGSFAILVLLLDFQHWALLATAYALMNNTDEIRQLLEWKGRITLSAEDEFLWLRLTVFGGIPPLFLVLRWLVPNEWLMQPYFLWSLFPTRNPSPCTSSLQKLNPMSLDLSGSGTPALFRATSIDCLSSHR